MQWRARTIFMALVIFLMFPTASMRDRTDARREGRRRGRKAVRTAQRREEREQREQGGRSAASMSS